MLECVSVCLLPNSDMNAPELPVTDAATNSSEPSSAEHNPDESGLTHECGVFGVIASGDWPTQVML